MTIFEKSGLCVKELEKRQIVFDPSKFSEIVSKNHSTDIYRIIEMAVQ
jgi:hypothetical protein